MKFIFVIIVLCFSLRSTSQNLVRNWSFEDTISCPTSFNQLNLAINWFTPRGGGGSSELYSLCNNTGIITPGFYGTPYNGVGFQIPKTGNNYAGFNIYRENYYWYGEFIEAKLDRSLNPNINYYVEFWVSLANESSHGIKNIGAYFSQDTIHYTSNIAQLINPDIEYNVGAITDTNSWTKISGYYKPIDEGINFITIGKFSIHDSTQVQLINGNSILGAYYYIDNVAVIDSALQHTIGIENEELKIKNEELKVYPNPASSDIILEFSSGLNQNVEIQIFNVMGNLVVCEKRFCQKYFALDVAKFRSGIYFIRVSDESGKIYSDKLIVE